MSSGYPHESIGALAQASVPTVRAGESVSDLKRLLASRHHAVVDIVVVLDRDGRYQGTADIREVLSAEDHVGLAALVRPDWPHVAPELDQEHAVEAASKAGVAALPVVAADGRFVGCVPPTTLLDVLAREHREDVHRLVGILNERTGARHALEDPPLERVRQRLPWLLAGLLLSTAGTALMAAYEHALRADVQIAFFIPALVYLTDAIGTQTEAIAVRGLSLRSSPLLRILQSEIATGAIIGATLGLLAFLGVWAFFGSLALGLGVGISLFGAGTIASVAGLLLPWLLGRLGTDPAFGSGPVATILQDVLTILVYFLVMTSILSLPG